ncbi:thioredoxin family protein [Poseidonibacter lekithochrous]|uniref:thioredoxin family protein n=1 Tax=Poseidonibacter TaxID=2321187 RepID=UPI001C0A4389|nr:MULTISPECIES: thioredoxin domain-containing protein [Poseidonibacter]MBU3015401.1 thioredoxin family protein [Poseidonibacter lekithochrous]MDO6828700.1 thioredoxin domain-containing protein [Poseidonibacter sp. 1_MG-2023]
MKKLFLLLSLSFSSLFAFEHLTLENIEDKLKNKNVIIDFYATWCPSCKVLGKNLTKYNTSKQSDIEIYKLDIEKQKLLTAQFEIKAIPTLIYLENGKIVAKEIGVRSIEQLKDYEKEYFTSSSNK